MRANLCIAIFAVCVTKALCSCFRGPLEVEKTVSGRIREYCEYEGLKMMKGAKFETLDCLKCTCSKNGLGCCGVGYMAGVIEPPPRCDMIPDGCRPLFVMSKDHSKRCLTGRPVLRNP